MGEQLGSILVREATGLVREVSSLDAFMMNLSASLLGPAPVHVIVGTAFFLWGPKFSVFRNTDRVVE